MKKNTVYALFDGRYRTDESAAICFEVCDSPEEAQKNAKNYGNDTVIVETITEGSEIKSTKIIN